MVLARFHLLYDGEDTDLEANKSKSKLRGLFLLCEAGRRFLSHVS